MNKSKIQGKSGRKKAQRPAQTQSRQPGRQRPMRPQPRSRAPGVKGYGRLAGKVALITGGDSGIGRAVALAFAREGASVAVAYLEEVQDAQDTRRAIEEEGGRCLLLKGDVGSEAFCRRAVERTVEELGHL